MLNVIIVLLGLFCLLFALRLLAAGRLQWLSRWPAVLLALAAIAIGLRGAYGPAIGLAALSVVVWMLWPRQYRAPPPPGPPPEDPADVEARRLLGVAAGASEEEIRRAFRDRIAKAHPDRGGRHADAARLVAARDRLLGRRR
ncbi:MAG: DnaJ domain-containing protein [Hyphomonadaceae bacterium]